MIAEMTEKLTPSNINAERYVIGSMLLDKDAVAKSLDIINFRDFYAPNHQIIVKIIQDLVKKNIPIDLATVSNSLQSHNYLEDVGSYSYLLDLTDSVPTTANIEIYAKMVNESYLRRELLNIYNTCIQDAYDTSKSFSEVLNNAETLILGITQKNLCAGLENIKNTLIENQERHSLARDGIIVEDKETVKTHIESVDNMVKMRSGDLIILGARPGVGKSSYAMNIAANIALKGKLPVAIFSLEMSKDQLVDRLVSAESEIHHAKLATGMATDDQWDKYMSTVADLMMADIHVDDFVENSVSDIRSKCRKLINNLKIQARENFENPNDVKLGAIVIDYLQLMDQHGDKGNGGNRVQEISQITRGLKKLAKIMGCPVIALSQLSRALETRQNKRPQLSDLRESGSIEMDADVVMFLYRDELYNPDTAKSRIAELIIAKHRTGATGTIELFFDPALTKFSGLEN